jgi:hypothetical protein
VLSDILGGGTGAHAHGPGLDGVDTYMANVGLMPVEVAETNYAGPDAKVDSRVDDERGRRVFRLDG